MSATDFTEACRKDECNLFRMEAIMEHLSLNSILFSSLPISLLKLYFRGKHKSNPMIFQD